MTHKEFDQYLLSFPNAWLDFPFGEGTSVYKVGHKETGEGKLFDRREAIIGRFKEILH
jgi:predicted DNA-binding protein (MmcQ/YjbR family)